MLNSYSGKIVERAVTIIKGAKIAHDGYAFEPWDTRLFKIISLLADEKIAVFEEEFTDRIVVKFDGAEISEPISEFPSETMVAQLKLVFG